MTTFTDLPDMGNGLRLVGTSVMDREQFDVEQWHLDRGEWRATLAGLQRYSQLRRQRRGVRQAQREADDAWSDEVNSMIAEQEPTR